MKYVSLLFVCTALFLGSCKSPTDVDAYRDKKVEQIPVEDLRWLEIGNPVIDFRGVSIHESDSVQVILFNTSQTNPLEIRSLKFRNGYFTARAGNDKLPIRLKAQERAGSDKQIYIKFSPKDFGDFIDTLVLNDSKDKFIIVKGKCSNGEPMIDVIETDTLVSILYFNDCSTTYTIDKHITIRNSSDYAITITGCPLDMDPNSGFNTHLQYPVTLEPGARTSFVFTFRPKEVKDYSRKLKFIVDGHPGLVEVCDIKAKGIKE